MKLGDRHIIDGKEYVAVYDASSTCHRCAHNATPRTEICNSFTHCKVYTDNRTQYIAWIEVKGKTRTKWLDPFEVKK